MGNGQKSQSTFAHGFLPESPQMEQFAQWVTWRGAGFRRPQADTFGRAAPSARLDTNSSLLLICRNGLAGDVLV